MGSILVARGLYDASSPPASRDRLQNNPSLLYSWWCTCFSIVIILFRLGGRYVRSERWFREDVVMALSIVPLFVRMGFVHVILLYETNNAANPELFSDDEVRRREIGSGLVLAARIFYAMFLWTAKFTITEFLKRLTESFWRKEFETALRCIRYFLLMTFVVVVIATLTECQPFTHYWQVRPDPGPQCRLGYAQLIAMGVTDIVTDVVLIVFPIPVIVNSALPMSRKLKLILLFSMSIVLVGVAGARVPYVIQEHGRQQYRTVWASTEILLATAVSNGVILGSFLRDRGVKKQKFKFGSTSESIDNHSNRRPTLTRRQWGSDEDLLRSVGMRLDPELTARPVAPRPAPMAAPATPRSGSMPGFVDKSYHYPGHDSCRDSEDSDLKRTIPIKNAPSSREARPSGRRVSFFDVGGLLEEGSIRKNSVTSSAPLVSPSLPTSNPHNDNNSNDPQPSSSTSRRGRSRVGSRALLADIGGLLVPSSRSQSRSRSRQWPLSNEGGIELASPMPEREDSPPIGVVGPTLRRHKVSNSLQDAGGLLEQQRLVLGSATDSVHKPTSSPPLSPDSPLEISQAPRSLLAKEQGSRDPPPSVPQVGSSLRQNQRKKPPPAITVPSSSRKKKRSSVQLQDVGGLLSSP